MHDEMPPGTPRPDEPLFTDATQRERWYAARRAAFAAVLEAATLTMFEDSLALRGSTLMKLWFGDAAREPGGVDFVVTGPNWSADDSPIWLLVDNIALDSGEVSRGAGIAVVDPHTTPSGGIRTHGRLPGRRLVLPWSAEDCPAGTVQIDFVLDESMPEPPEPVAFTTVTGCTATIPAASRAQSLAWKLQQLITEPGPRDEDLYDVALLRAPEPDRKPLTK
jgi:hypothetical protein